MKRIRLIIADDHPVVRRGLCTILSAEEDIEVVGQAKDGQEAVELAQREQPDVILMDLRMPEMDGVQAIRQLKQSNPGIRTIILTTYDNDEFLFEGIRAGARGYLLKDIPPEDLIAAIRATDRGQSLIQPVVAAKLLDQFSHLAGKETREADLTDRELEVLRLMVKGARNKEIAEALCITEKTVKAHVSSIFQKLQVTHRTEAVTRALERGMVRL